MSSVSTLGGKSCSRTPSRGESGRTGIFKRPVASPVVVTLTGLAGDCIADTKNHGGPDQAVYVVGVPDYRWWETQLGYPLAPGTFGENLLRSKLESASTCSGDRFRIGPILLEVAAPRLPCITLARHGDDTRFAKRFIAAGHPGLFCCVLETSLIKAERVITQERFAGPNFITALEMFRDFPGVEFNDATLRRYLAHPIASRARVFLQGILDDRQAAKQSAA